ncbi:hypothetical protein PV403_05205 [Paenibacillus sp. GYB006]|uniref:hypothetical protein n=1 Tax=Paenibacillus sp. GYB006 TaxID=2994394 RepID=UPI002F965CEC
MKNFISLTFSVFLCLALIACSGENNNAQTPDTPTTSETSETTSQVDYGLMDLANIYGDIGGIVEDSALIVEVEIPGTTEEITYGGADFVLSDATVVDVISGDRSYSNEEIELFEVKSFDINRTLEDGNRFILFLEKYEGPVYEEEAFVIIGAYQGKFNIDENNNVEYKASEYNGITTFQTEITPVSVEQFKQEIKDIVKEQQKN